MRRELFVAAAGLLTVAALRPGTAVASGLQTPNSLDARAIGWSGAYVAIADDPSAALFNPAGLAAEPSGQAVLGLEMISQQRTYTPADPTLPVQHANRPPLFLPGLGVSARAPAELSSRLVGALYLGVPYGGSMSYPRLSGVTGVESSTLADLELVGALAYEVDDLLWLGAGVRAGYGIFDSSLHNQPVDASLSLSAFGVGGVLGIMIRPTPSLTFGASYRTSLAMGYSGNATFQLPSGPTTMTANADVTWPWMASLGASWRPTHRVRFAVEGDYTGWSTVQTITATFAGGSVPPQVEYLRFHDALAGHVGGEVAATRDLAVRGGFTVDGNAIPDITTTRILLDKTKLAVDFGASLRLASRYRIDAAVDVLPPTGSRVVPDNGSTAPPGLVNPAPGSYDGVVLSVMVAGAVAF